MRDQDTTPDTVTMAGYIEADGPYSDRLALSDLATLVGRLASALRSRLEEDLEMPTVNRRDHRRDAGDLSVDAHRLAGHLRRDERALVAVERERVRTEEEALGA
jgi:hypothetical protein